MPLAFQAVWILSALGAAVFVTRSTGFSLWIFALGFAVPAAISYVPQPEQIGFLAALSAGISLFVPRWQPAASLFGGMVAGSLVPLIAQTGPAIAIATPLAAIIPVVTLVLARNPRFAPPVVLEEALLLLFVLGLGAALVPNVLEGWQTASGMNAPLGDNVSRTVPAWALAVGGASLLLGSGWAVWRSR